MKSTRKQSACEWVQKKWTTDKLPPCLVHKQSPEIAVFSDNEDIEMVTEGKCTYAQ